MKRKFAIVISLALFSLPAMAWDETNMDTGDAVEIGKGNLVRVGEEIEVYDHGTGTYRYVTVEDITGGGSTVYVEVYDNDTGEYLLLEMEDCSHPSFAPASFVLAGAYLCLKQDKLVAVKRVNLGWVRHKYTAQGAL